MTDRMTEADASLGEAMGRSNTWGRDVRLRVIDDWKRAREYEATMSRENGDLLQALVHKDAEIAALRQRIKDLESGIEGADEILGVREATFVAEIAALKADNAALVRALEANAPTCLALAAEHPGASLLAEMESLRTATRALAVALSSVNRSDLLEMCWCHHSRDIKTMGHSSYCDDAHAAISIPEAQRQLAEAGNGD